MTIFLLLCLIVTECFTYLECRKFNRNFREIHRKKQQTPPPKSRGSFVVKRMEERLKEALYQ